MTIFQRALKAHVGNRLNLVLLLVLPFPLLLIPAPGQDLPFGLSLHGMLIFYTAFLLARPLAEDRMRGIMVRIAASPVSTLAYLGGHLGAALLLLGGQSALFLGASALVHHLAPPLYLGLYGLYLSFALMGTSFALAWNSLFRSYNLSFALFSGIGSLLCLVSGVSLPQALIPQGIQRYTMVLPTYWLPQGILALQEGKLDDLFWAHAILWAYALVFLVAGTRRHPGHGPG